MFDSGNSLPSQLPGFFTLDRRADVRYEYDSRDGEPKVKEGSDAFSANILNISAGGLAFLADRRIERGTLLSTELPSKDELGSRRLVMSVKLIEARDGGVWKIGCEFARKLTAMELLALL